MAWLSADARSALSQEASAHSAAALHLGAYASPVVLPLPITTTTSASSLQGCSLPAAPSRQAAQIIGGEADWLQGALPDHFPRFLISLLSTLLGLMERPYRQRLGAAMAAPPGSVLPLEHLEQAQAATRAFAAVLAHSLAGAGALSVAEFGRRLYGQALAPVEEALLHYPDREQQYLSAELQQIARGGGAAQAAAAAGGEAEGAAGRLGATIPPATAALEAALSRCLRLTGGTGLPALARVLDRVVTQYVGALDAGASALSRQEGGSGASDLDAAEAAVPLLAVAAELQQAVAALGAGLQEVVVEHVPHLLVAAADPSAEAVLDESTGLLNDALPRARGQPALAQQLSALAATSTATTGTPASRLLPSAAAAAAELERQVCAHVEQVLTQRVRQLLAGLPALPEWQQRQGALPLPTFSAYPLQYVTSGETGAPKV